MDSELREKINRIVKEESIETDDNELILPNYQIGFSIDGDGLIEVVGGKGSFAYQLKELEELYLSSEEASDIEPDWEDDHYLSLLYAIESAIRRADDYTPGLADSMVITALEKLAIKPELKEDNPIIKEINQQLRAQLSLCNYSRYEVKRAIRKILGSVKRHNRIDGIRGYLDFIKEYVP